ncbi:MAG: SMC-Scp complex subunit ScpB [Bacteroidota bacterium]
MGNHDFASIVEAIIFGAQQPVQLDFIQEVLKQSSMSTSENGAGASATEENQPPTYTKKDIQQALEQLMIKYKEGEFGFELREVAEGYQFLSKSAYYPYVRKAALIKNKKRLSKTALETLAIIAYRQPITKSEIEFIRGVNCDYAVQKLLDKKLLTIIGRSDAPGRPLLYGTSPFFMEYFGIRDMSDLPKLKEFEATEEEHLALFRKHQEELTQADGEKSTGEAVLRSEEAEKPQE